MEVVKKIKNLKLKLKFMSFNCFNYLQLKISSTEDPKPSSSWIVSSDGMFKNEKRRWRRFWSPNESTDVDLGRPVKVNGIDRGSRSNGLKSLKINDVDVDVAVVGVTTTVGGLSSIVSTTVDDAAADATSVGG